MAPCVRFGYNSLNSCWFCDEKHLLSCCAARDTHFSAFINILFQTLKNNPKIHYYQEADKFIYLVCICTWSMIIKGNGKCTICICTWSMIKVMVYVHYVYVHGL